MSSHSPPTARPSTADTLPIEQEKFGTTGVMSGNHLENGNGINGVDYGNSPNGYNLNAPLTQQSHHGYGGYNDNPLRHVNTNMSARNAPFAGYLEPGLYKPKKSNLANPAPLGLCAFALTTFVLSLINFQTQGVSEPNVVVALAFGYGGLVQLLAGMWEMATGNTFGATALSSYGGFWLSYAILLTPGGFEISNAYAGDTTKFQIAIGFYLMGWFIFTFMIWLLTLRSTVVFCLLFFWLWLAFLMLGIAHLITPAGGDPNANLIKAGGMFGLLAAFFAWYIAFAGIADSSNSFFTIPVWHFPWSDKGRENRKKVSEEGKDA